ncbi:MAG: hypothetical protein GX846_10555 [Deltaproteobacteria bacterium]|nr:hypothetical protein [Deltaproteobacteria bacterium]
MDNKLAGFAIGLYPGRMTKWLRIMGFSIHYHPINQNGKYRNTSRTKSILLAKRLQAEKKLLPFILVTRNKIKDQLPGG